MKYTEKVMKVMIKELMGLAPPDVEAKPKTLEGETVKRIVEAVKKLALRFDAEKGQLFSTIPWGHIINAADKQPGKTREGLVTLTEILDDYKARIRRLDLYENAAP